ASARGNRDAESPVFPGAGTSHFAARDVRDDDGHLVADLFFVEARDLDVTILVTVVDDDAHRALPRGAARSDVVAWLRVGVVLLARVGALLGGHREHDRAHRLTRDGLDDAVRSEPD